MKREKLSFKDRLIYHFLVILGYTLAYTPRFIKFGLADIITFLLYHVVKYRRAVVRKNLTLSFPEKSKKEIIKIEKDYYKHLGDLFVDSLAMVGASEKTMKKHFTYDDDEFQEFIKTSPAICAMSHYGSWEYTVGYPLRVENMVCPVYRPLHGKASDEFYLKMRSRFGGNPCMMSAVVKRIIRNKGNNVVMAMLADQTPIRNNEHRWYTFLNQDTQFFIGIGELAKHFKMGVFFLEITKVKRGYYHAKMVRIYDGMEDINYETIIERYINKLEAMIKREPHLWTWSHKRWKHKKLF
ncbi:MAG: lysophospholipid acyltransferase family protein [Bacteroidetes bacterium]|nr:lysophospholipid acyltransferase family protein [Bacteroidota bacterium]